MEQRVLGRTGASVSALGFGCGAVGGLMVRGSASDQERAVARALELGITYFDTAAAYGDGASEENLGRVLRTLRPEIFLSTKFTVLPEDRPRLGDAVAASLERSLKRLGREQVDLLQLHNRIAASGDDRPLASTTVLQEVVPALERLREQGKIRFFGITALGDTDELRAVVEARAFDTAQICCNLLNPSAVMALPPGARVQDFRGLATHAQSAGMGTICIRVLAGGALSGSEARHPLGMQTVAPIASGPDYRADVQWAQRFQALVAAGHAGSLVEAALRFAVGESALSTALVGLATLEQLEFAAAAVERGPLPRVGRELLASLWHSMGTGTAG